MPHKINFLFKLLSFQINAFAGYFESEVNKLVLRAEQDYQVRSRQMGVSVVKKHLSPTSTAGKLENINVTTRIVKKAINKLSNSGALSADNLSNSILKKLNNTSFLEMIVNIVEKSFSIGIVPPELKIAKVVPLNKKNSIYELGNYRPISIISCISKIMETIFKNNLLAHLNIKKFFSEYQFGFLPHGSTDKALLRHLTLIGNGIREWVAALYKDLKKAFDTVSHPKLIEVLESEGLDGKAKSWLQSYLTKRYQYVEVNGSNSRTYEITAGVPQGSILGPLLFISLMNGIVVVVVGLMVS